MALVKTFTDNCGNNYTSSYWRAVRIDIHSQDQSINISFTAYKDADSYQAGKSPLPGGMKTYAVQGADFMAVAAAAPVGSTLYDVLAHAVEDYALGKLDTPSGQVDGSGKPILVSFFDGATQV